MEGLHNAGIALDEPPVIPGEPQEGSKLLQALRDWPSLKGSDFLGTSLNSIPGDHMPQITDECLEEGTLLKG